MEQKINIAERLKDCPKGMELDCTMYDNVTLIQVQEDNIYPIKIETPDGSTVLTKYGGISYNELSKCIIFPKGKTTWEGFQRPFKDGDVVISNHGDIHINRDNLSSYCCLRRGCFDATITTLVKFDRLATEEEKQKLFDAIKDNGYNWNAETKTLEKIIVPKFKVGDKIKEKNERFPSTRTIDNYVEGIGYYTTIHDWVRIEDQDEWELVPTHKFKVGDIIQDITGICKVKITEVNVEDKCYLYKSLNINGIGGITFNRQDDWELVLDKFDITTLVPFESKVLVRDINSDNWIGAFYSHYKPGRFYTIGNSYYYQCIPYEGNEHLRGTTNDCDEYFKNW